MNYCLLLMWLLTGLVGMNSKNTFTAAQMNKLDRVSDVSVSPDGTHVLYGVSHCLMEENRNVRDLYLIGISGGEPQRLTATESSESNARWINDNEILFLYRGRLHKMNIATGCRQEIQNAPEDVEAFSLSPDKSRILIIRGVRYATRPTDLDPTLTKATGRYITHLMYRHWDCFVETIPHPFWADFDGERLTSAPKDILEGTLFECPTLPFGDTDQLAWSPDGKKIAYSCRKKTYKDYALSTNTDIYLYNMESGTEENLTEGMEGYDTTPVFSPDGKYLLWLSMERDGYEADKNRLFCLELGTGVKRDLSSQFPYNTDAMAWSADSGHIYATSNVHGVVQLFEVNLARGYWKALTSGEEVSFGAPVPLGKDRILTTVVSMSMPTEIAIVNPKNGSWQQVSHVNDALLGELALGRVESKWIPTTNGEQMQMWVVYPPDFDASKKYPALLFCEGGPQNTITQSWSFRWNFQLMAAQGYVVVAPNRHGTTAFGQAWTEQISGDYAGQNIQDYFAATDYMKAQPYIDGAHFGAVGASYGGYSVFYLAGHHEGRYAAFIAHAGIFDQEHMYMTTEEMWFPHWDNGGAPWDTNAVAQRHYAHSPHKAVQHWDTPILITAGEMDYRVPVDQAMAAFNAAQLLGVESELLLFPEENHWILRPQNNLMWNQVFFSFLAKHLKN